MDEPVSFPISVSLARAHKLLESLYLGGEGEYVVHFSRDQLARVEDIFDIIIFTHGIKPVYFKYEIARSAGWRASPEQKIRIEKRSNKLTRSAS